MKTELQPVIKREGILNNSLCSLIAFHNEGKGTYSLQDILSYCKGKIVEYPNTLKNIMLTIMEDELIVLENGEHISICIKETKIK
jgi:hypothetical protein